MIAFNLQATCGIAALLEILDVAAWADDSFEISGGFKSYWRSHVWEGRDSLDIPLIFLVDSDESKLNHFYHDR